MAGLHQVKRASSSSSSAWACYHMMWDALGVCQHCGDVCGAEEGEAYERVQRHAIKGGAVVSAGDAGGVVVSPETTGATMQA